MTKDQKEKEIYFNLVLKNNSEELKNKLNEIGCEKWLSKACKIPKKIGIRELFDPKYLIEIENNFYRYIIENYKEIDIKREIIIFEWKTL